MPTTDHPATQTRTEPQRTESVMAPKDHAGVGKALRAAYLPRMSDMPNDLALLLDRLR